MQFKKMWRIAQNQREQESAVRISEHKIVTMSTDKQVTCAIDSGVMFRQPWNREGLAPCSHEAADSGMIVHIADAATKYKF